MGIIMDTKWGGIVGEEWKNKKINFLREEGKCLKEESKNVEDAHQIKRFERHQ